MISDKPKSAGKIDRNLIHSNLVKADFFRILNNGKVQCELCPRNCKLSEGQRGFCFAREAIQGQLASIQYGRVSGFSIDPIEKKPLNHFYPGTSILSFGTYGCNLGCRFCQNWSMSKARHGHRFSKSVSPQEVAQVAYQSGCESVAFTYNEPIIFAEFAIDCAKANREIGIQSVAVTSGYISPRARRDFFEFMDGVNIDLKAFNERFYRKLCSAHLDPVLETLRFLHNETDLWFEVTTLLIPGQNDSEDEISRLCEWFLQNLGPEVPLHFTAFHPDFKLKNIPATPSSVLKRARNQATSTGIKHVYTGNVHDVMGQSTFCAKCGNLLIERNYYHLGEYSIDSNGNCSSCGYKVAGRFSSTKRI